MRRLLLSVIAAGLGLAIPTAALATQSPGASSVVTGTLTSASPYSVMIQTAGRPTGVMGALTTAADRITAQDYPYVWGGGHAQAGVASVGLKGPGHNGKRRGYDCSGSVAAVLEAGGLWPVGAGVPNDAGVIHYLLQRGEIAPGAGVGPTEVTLYDEPGVHIFMNIDGRFFGTSDGGGGGDRRGGPGWLDDGAWDAHNPRFHRFHVLPSALKGSTDAGYTLAFQLGRGVDLATGYPVGARVRVAYSTTNQGTMVAQSLTLVGLRTVTGVIQAIAPDGSSFTIITPSGRTVGFPTAGQPSVAQALLDGQVVTGDTVSVGYINMPTLTIVSVTVTAPPATTTTTTTTTTPTTTTPTTTTPTTTPTTTTPTTTTPTTTTAAGGGQQGVGVGGWSGGSGF